MNNVKNNENKYLNTEDHRIYMCFAQTAPKLLFGTIKLTSVKDRLDKGWIGFSSDKKKLGVVG